jgi:hypothetical protein
MGSFSRFGEKGTTIDAQFKLLEEKGKENDEPPGVITSP